MREKEASDFHMSTLRSIMQWSLPVLVNACDIQTVLEKYANEFNVSCDRRYMQRRCSATELHLVQLLSQLRQLNSPATLMSQPRISILYYTLIRSIPTSYRKPGVHN